MTTGAAYHVEMDSDGIARLPGTSVKVREIAEEHLAYGWSAEMIHDQHPDLPLPRIYAALAFFYEHEAEMLEEMRRASSMSAEVRIRTENPALQARLRSVKPADA